ncbi:MAG: penicillin-binding protein 2 [Verrucomicrobiota bacterium]|nr:MAG: penicillin-binding protein 2 [Verrucomicrobiota bacterium]
MDPAKKSLAEQRIFLLCFILLGIFLFLIGGLFYRQVTQHSYFLQKGKYQTQRRVFLPAPRGDILDRQGRVIACDQPLFELHLYFDSIRKEIREQYLNFLQEHRQKKQPIDRVKFQQQARQSVVQRHLDRANAITHRHETLDITKLEHHYHQSLLAPFTLLSNLTTEEYVRLTDQLPVNSPLFIATNYCRKYPYGSAACHVLGYVSMAYDLPQTSKELRSFFTGHRAGKTGIELSQNAQLSGIDGEEIFAVDPVGFRSECVERIAPEKGKECQLSIDIRLQQAVEKAISGYQGSAIVLDVSSGEVLALANTPAYDPNLLSPKIPKNVFQEITQRGAWLNRAIQGCYPPASTFKIISSIAFLRNNIATWDANDTENCPGKTKIGTRLFHCDHKTAHGQVSLAAAMKKSCNVYYYRRSQECGIQNIAQEARRFRLDQPTGIELPFETHRMTIADPEWKKQKKLGEWFGGDTANTAIGQGYTLVTPLQMACFIASIAANRTFTRPHILHDAHHTQTAPTIGLNHKDYRQLITTLQEVVRSGTGRRAQYKNIAIAGKSGTAQVWEHGERRNVAWFIGFAPVEKPTIALAVAIQETSSNDNYYGGKTAGPVAHQIFEAYFH